MTSWRYTIGKNNIILIILFLTLILGVLIPNSPTYRPIPYKDSGIFLYVGQQILDGKIPYRDIWDHKPPMIFYIDAIGILIGNTWGVWVIEVISLSFACALGFFLIKRAFGVLPAIFGSIIWLISLFSVLEGGNLTEEFALPFQFATLLLFQQSEIEGTYKWKGFLIGSLSAITFLLKPNLIGVSLGIVSFIILTRIKNRQRLIEDLFMIFIGALFILVTVSVFFSVQNALDRLLDSVFVFNFIYSEGGIRIEHLLKTITIGLYIFNPSYIMITTIVGWFFGNFYLYYKRNENILNKETLLLVSLIGLPIEFLLSSFSGRTYGHYYMAWLPIAAILSSFSIYTVIKGLSLGTNEKNKKICTIFIKHSHISNVVI